MSSTDDTPARLPTELIIETAKISLAIPPPYPRTFQAEAHALSLVCKATHDIGQKVFYSTIDTPRGAEILMGGGPARPWTDGDHSRFRGCRPRRREAAMAPVAYSRPYGGMGTEGVQDALVGLSISPHRQHRVSSPRMVGVALHALSLAPSVPCLTSLSIDVYIDSHHPNHSFYSSPKLDLSLFLTLLSAFRSLRCLSLSLKGVLPSAVSEWQEAVLHIARADDNLDGNSRQYCSEWHPSAALSLPCLTHLHLDVDSSAFFLLYILDAPLKKLVITTDYASTALLDTTLTHLADHTQLEYLKISCMPDSHLSCNYPSDTATSSFHNFLNNLPTSLRVLRLPCSVGEEDIMHGQVGQLLNQGLTGKKKLKAVRLHVLYRGWCWIRRAKSGRWCIERDPDQYDSVPKEDPWFEGYHLTK